MVETKSKTGAARAKIAHKLARYYRATPVHLTGITGTSQPSTSHLSISSFTQPSEVLPSADSEIRITPGTLLMMTRSTSREPETSPNPTLDANPSSPDQSSSSFPVSAEADVSSSLKLSLPATFWSPDPMPSTASPSGESTPPTSLPLP